MCSFSKLFQQCHTGRLKSVMVAIFTPQTPANIKMRAFFLWKAGRSTLTSTPLAMSAMGPPALFLGVSIGGDHILVI